MEDGSRSMFGLVHSTIKGKSKVPLHNIRDEPGKPPFNQYICLGCGKKAATVVFMTCSRCKAVKYCSKECQVKDWKGLGQGPTKPRKHKDICPELQAAILEFESHPTAGITLRTQVFQEWANQHHPEDGSFHGHEFLGRNNLLGGAEVGFWAIPDVLTPYHTSGQDCHGFQNGQMLLQESFPSMTKGWTKALTLDERVDVTEPPTQSLTTKGLRGWEDYLKLRNLPGTSIAPLLMTNVLTIYQMIKYELALPEKAEGSHLLVYVLAVEAELNQIPLLHELLYLLPGTDLELVYLSPAAKAICDESEGKDCLLTSSEYVLDLQDPSINSRLRVKIDHQHALYDDVPNDLKPDAVIGLNAGLGSYQAWKSAMHKIVRMQTLFCFSDQTQLIHQFTKTNWLPSVLSTINAAFPQYRQLEVPNMTIKLNPFHGIVSRDVAYVLSPNLSNGYLLTASTYS